MFHKFGDPQTCDCCNCWSEGVIVGCCSLLLEDPLPQMQNRGQWADREEKGNVLLQVHFHGNEKSVRWASREAARLLSCHFTEFPTWEHPAGWLAGPKVRKQSKPEGLILHGMSYVQRREYWWSFRALACYRSLPAFPAGRGHPQRLPLLPRAPTHILSTRGEKGRTIKDDPHTKFSGR